MSFWKKAFTGILNQEMPFKNTNNVENTGTNFDKFIRITDNTCHRNQKHLSIDVNKINKFKYLNI